MMRICQHPERIHTLESTRRASASLQHHVIRTCHPQITGARIFFSNDGLGRHLPPRQSFGLSSLRVGLNLHRTACMAQEKIQFIEQEETYAFEDGCEPKVDQDDLRSSSASSKLAHRGALEPCLIFSRYHEIPEVEKCVQHERWRRGDHSSFTPHLKAISL